MGHTRNHPAGFVGIGVGGQPQWRAGSPHGGVRVFATPGSDILFYSFEEEVASIMRISSDGALHWEATVEKYLFSGPFLAGSSVVMTTHDEGLVVLDAVTGEQSVVADLGYDVSGLGLVADGMAYLGSWDGRVLDVDQSGAVREFPVPGQGVSVHLVTNGRAVFSTDGGLAALDLESGDILWSVGDQQGFGDGLLADESLILPGEPRGVRSLNLESGGFEWQFFGRSADVGLIRYGAPLVVATLGVGRDGGYDTVHLVAGIDPADDENLAWDRPLPGRPQVLEIHDGMILIGGGRGSSADAVDSPADGWFSAYDLVTGELLWSLDTREPPNSIEIRDGAIFMLTTDNWIGCD